MDADDKDVQDTARRARATSQYVAGLATRLQGHDDATDLGHAVRLAEESLSLLGRILPFEREGGSTGGTEGVSTGGIAAALSKETLCDIRDPLIAMRTESPRQLGSRAIGLDQLLIAAIEQLDVDTANLELAEFIATEAQRVLGELRTLLSREHDAGPLPNVAMAVAGVWSVILGGYVLSTRLAPKYRIRTALAVPFPYQPAMWGAGVVLTVFGVAAVAIATFVPLRKPHPFDRLRLAQWVFTFLAPFLLAGAALFLLVRSRTSGGDVGALAAAVAFGVGATVVGVASGLVERGKGGRTPAGAIDATERASGSWPLLPPGADLSEQTDFLARLEVGIRRRVFAEAQLARRWNWANYTIGGMAALLAGLGGAAGLSKLSGPPKVALGVLGLIGSGLAGIVTTLKAGGNAESSDRRKVDYDALLLDLRRARDKAGDSAVGEAVVDELVSRLEHISGATSGDQRRDTVKRKPRPPRI